MIQIRGMHRVRRAARWLRNAVTAKPLVLLYHRVADVQSDPQSLCVTRQNFAEHMEVLRRAYNPISLRLFNARLSRRNLPRRGILVTFDDGYSDNLYNAKPILGRHGVPATVFVSGGYVGYEGEYWWDHLEQLILRPGTLPESLAFHLNGTDVEWKLGGAAFYSEESHRLHEAWSIADKTVPTDRHSLYLKLYHFIQPLPLAQRTDVFDTLNSWAGRRHTSREGYRPMTAVELKKLVEGDLIDIGAHTMSHPVLSSLPIELQRQEIDESKTLLEAVLERPLTSFAYPYGGPSTFTAQTVAAVQAAGFTSAYVTSPGPIRKDCDPFRLSRHVIGNWDGERFARRLRKWLSED